MASDAVGNRGCTRICPDRVPGISDHPPRAVRGFTPNVDPTMKRSYSAAGSCDRTAVSSFCSAVHESGSPPSMVATIACSSEMPTS